MLPIELISTFSYLVSKRSVPAFVRLHAPLFSPRHPEQVKVNDTSTSVSRLRPRKGNRLLHDHLTCSQHADEDASCSK